MFWKNTRPSETASVVGISAEVSLSIRFHRSRPVAASTATMPLSRGAGVAVKGRAGSNGDVVSIPPTTTNSRPVSQTISTAPFVASYVRTVFPVAASNPATCFP